MAISRRVRCDTTPKRIDGETITIASSSFHWRKRKKNRSPRVNRFRSTFSFVGFFSHSLVSVLTVVLVVGGPFPLTDADIDDRYAIDMATTGSWKIDDDDTVQVDDKKKDKVLDGPRSKGSCWFCCESF